MSDKLVCVVCGEEIVTSNDFFCKKHKVDFLNHKIDVCDKCGKWHYKDIPCERVKEKYFVLPAYGFEKCVVCGANTKGYAFCKKCFNKYAEDEMLEILNNLNCEEKSNSDEEVEIINEQLQCDSDFIYEEQGHVIIIDSNSSSKCIICGEQTNGLLFCLNCYHRYKNKELLFRVTNCCKIELVSSTYESKYITKDGHVVKSKSEREIDNYFFEHNIPHVYEPELAYGVSEKEVLHPDFVLPNYLGNGKDVYIEHWGYNEENVQYKEMRNYKMPIYKELGITLVNIYENVDAKNIHSVLNRKLKKSFIKENEING